MSVNVQSVGHELEDFEGTYAIWAVPFSLLILVIFVAIIVLWAPAAATREMRLKEIEGAEASRQSLLEHRAEQEAFLAGSGGIPVERAMDELVRKNASGSK
jgi:hypothetical protein